MIRMGPHGGRSGPAKSDAVEGNMEDQEALDLAADWADISQGLRKDLGHQLFSQWIRPIQLGTFCKETGTLNLFLPTEFSANWVQDRFHDRLSLAWKIARSEVKNVKIAVHPGRRKLADLDFKGEDGFGHRAANDGSPGGTIAGGLAMESIGEDGFTSSVGLDPSLTFAAFVTGATNVLAKNAAERMAVAEKPQFSPLYLKAATGQGKTHLLHAIGHSYMQAHPRARIFYCSAERFMVEFVSALKSNEMIEFKARLRGFDLLLVDDIQFIIGKASAQEELLYTIDALVAEGKRLVFAADRAPQALDGVEPRLLSRLSMGLVADIQPADIELRRLILQSKLVRFAPLEVPADVIEFLARTINRNVRELVGGLNKLIAYAQLTGQEVSLSLAEEQLTDILSANRRRITIDEIQRTVCQFYRIDRARWCGPARWRCTSPRS
jgi:chromosomal replication initiator protein